MLNMGGNFLFDEESLQSSSSSTPPSPTSTESSFLSSSNSENLNPTANWNLNDLLFNELRFNDLLLNDSPTEPTTTTFSGYSWPPPSTQGSSDGIYEDHSGLNPSSERTVELQSDKHEQLGELMINRSPQDVLVVAEAYTERQEPSFSSGNMEPVGVEYSSVAVTSSRSPVESEEIVASVDSSLSPMIRPPPPQTPLPSTNWMLNGSGLNSVVPPDSRLRIVNKIMENLKRHLHAFDQEGLHELRKIAIRFEENSYTSATSQSDYLRKISLKMLTMETEENSYTAATSQSDYLRKISLKMLTMETESQNPIGYDCLPSNSAGNTNKSPDAASLDYSTAQTGRANGADWQEEVYQKIKTLKDLYLPEISEMYQKIAAKLQLHDSLPQQSKSDQLEKLKIFKTMLERIITFLQVSKNNIPPGYKEKLGSYEKQIVNFINTNRPKKPALQQGQLPAPHMQTMQQPHQLAQIQSHENQINPQLQSMSLQGSVPTMPQNSMSSLQHNSMSLSGASTAQPNMMNSLQPGSNLNSGQGNS